MRRSALGTFFQRVILSTLPLAGCTGDPDEPDLAPPADLQANIDFSSPLANCFAMNPDITVYPNPDGGISWDGGMDVVCLQFCPVGYYGGCMPSDDGGTGMIPDGGGSPLICSYDCFGRRPTGFSPASLVEGERDDDVRAGAIGRHFARMAELEAASVVAFEHLAEELRRFDAPAALVDAARQAAKDEQRHTHFASGVAEQHGSKMSDIVAGESSPHTLLDLAIENAVEGCVRETFGALLVTFQARCAGDAIVRAGLKRVARDETRHAELAWTIHRWMWPMLTRAQRTRVTAAMQSAVQELANRTTEPSTELCAFAGLPQAHQARQLLSAVRDELWAA